MTTTTAIGRGARGHFLPGNSGNGGGRPRLPDWYKLGNDDAMRVSYAAALGKLPPGDNPPAAMAFVLVEGQPDPIDPKLRLEQCARIMDRVLGKAPEMLEVGNASAVLDVLVALAKPVGDKPEDP